MDKIRKPRPAGEFSTQHEKRKLIEDKVKNEKNTDFLTSCAYNQKRLISTKFIGS